MLTTTPLPRPPAARAAGGLRERKKQKTRNAIQRAALRLFKQQGYDETTIEQIAEAVEISPSTFFNYFPTKEDVVLSDEYDPLFISAFQARPSDEPLTMAIRRTLVEGMAAAFERDRELVLERGKLMLREPALRARLWESAEQGVDLFCTLLAQRTGRTPDDFDLRVIAWTVVSALFEAEKEWLRHDGRDDLLRLINRALDIVEAGARLDTIETALPRYVVR